MCIHPHLLSTALWAAGPPRGHGRGPNAVCIDLLLVYPWKQLRPPYDSLFPFLGDFSINKALDANAVKCLPLLGTLPTWGGREDAPHCRL